MAHLDGDEKPVQVSFPLNPHGLFSTNARTTKILSVCWIWMITDRDQIGTAYIILRTFLIICGGAISSPIPPLRSR